MERGVFRGELDDEQRSAFALILEGKTGREIAAILGVTPTRIEAVVRRTCRQLDTTSRHDAAKMLASHYGWLPGDRIPRSSTSSRKRGCYDGPEKGFFASTMVQTEREHPARSGYVRDVGNQALDKVEDTGAYNDVAGRISVSKLVAASSLTQGVLLMALLIVSCALALSACVSAMQGFDTLFFP